MGGQVGSRQLGSILRVIPYILFLAGAAEPCRQAWSWPVQRSKRMTRITCASCFENMKRCRVLNITMRGLTALFNSLVAVFYSVHL